MIIIHDKGQSLTLVRNKIFPGISNEDIISLEIPNLNLEEIQHKALEIWYKYSECKCIYSIGKEQSTLLLLIALANLRMPVTLYWENETGGFYKF